MNDGELARLDAALELLEVHVGHPQTMALHDPIYLARRDADSARLLSAVCLLDAGCGHPAAAQLQLLLAPWSERPEPSLHTVLAAHGPVPEGVDLLVEVERRLARAADARRVLDERVGILEAQRRVALQTANGMAAVTAIFAIFALAGWLAALGWYDVNWSDVPAPPPEPEAGVGGPQ